MQPPATSRRNPAFYRDQTRKLRPATVRGGTLPLVEFTPHMRSLYHDPSVSFLRASGAA